MGVKDHTNLGNGHVVHNHFSGSNKVNEHY